MKKDIVKLERELVVCLHFLKADSTCQPASRLARRIIHLALYLRRSTFFREKSSFSTFLKKHR